MIAQVIYFTLTPRLFDLELYENYAYFTIAMDTIISYKLNKLYRGTIFMLIRSFFLQLFIFSIFRCRNDPDLNLESRSFKKWMDQCLSNLYVLLKFEHDICKIGTLIVEIRERYKKRKKRATYGEQKSFLHLKNIYVSIYIWPAISISYLLVLICVQHTKLVEW